MSELIALGAACAAPLLLHGLTGGRLERLRARVTPYRGGPGRSEGSSRPWPILSADPRIEKLLQATAGGALRELRISQAAWAGAAALPAIFGAAVRIVDPVSAAALAGLGGVAGWLGRLKLLERRAQRAGTARVDQLPVAIDLIGLCVIAGASIPDAFRRVSGMLGSGIGDEIRSVDADLRAGAGAVDALESLARRWPDSHVVRFCDALCSAIENGTPLAEVLRDQAEDARDAQRARLLELGGRREVLMLVPVVFLIMPVVIVFALWPGLVALEVLGR